MDADFKKGFYKPMTRFSQLEFDGADKEKPNEQIGEPVHDTAYYYKEAIRCRLAGDFELALRNYSRMLEMNNMRFEGWLGQTLMLIELGEYAEAAIWANKALDLFPQQPELYAARAVAYHRDLKKADAIKSSDTAIDIGNQSAYVWLSRAEIMYPRKHSVAENCLSKAISAAGKEGALVKLEAARIMKHYGNRHAAIEYLNEVVRVFPKSALAWYELGCCQSELGLSAAKAALEQSLILRPRWNAAENALAKCKPSFLKRLFRR